MKYAQPYGVTDPNAPYINGDPSIGRPDRSRRRKRSRTRNASLLR